MKIPPYTPRSYKNLLCCLIRDDWVQKLPEEKVRQRVLNYLLKKHKYDKHHIKLEERINYNKKEKRELNKEFGRADILLLNQKEKSWLIVECKKSHGDNGQKYQISDDDIEQAQAYAKAKYVNKIWITTGDENIFQKKHGDAWIDVKSPFILNDTEFWPRESDSKISFPKSNSKRDLKNYFKKDCPDVHYKNYFDKFTDEDEAIFVSSIQKLIHKLNFEKWVAADCKKRKGFRIIEDRGVTRKSFGNPGYGPKAHQNLYRTILCKYDGQELIVSLGVYPEKNCPSLCMGVRPEDSNPHHSLELNYQKYVYTAKNNFVLWHPGHIGGGQLAPGKAKATEVIKYMENHDIKAVRDLIKRDTGSNPRVELGSMPLFWSKTTDGLIGLVRNLFLYGAVRHVYRETYKKQDLQAGGL